MKKSKRIPITEVTPFTFNHSPAEYLKELKEELKWQHRVWKKSHLPFMTFAVPAQEKRFQVLSELIEFFELMRADRIELMQLRIVDEQRANANVLFPKESAG